MENPVQKISLFFNFLITSFPKNKNCLMDLNTKEIFVVGYLIFIPLPLLNVKSKLSGILAKSGPLDFATKNSFPLFFVCEKGLVHMYQNHFIYFPILYFCFEAKNQF